MPEKLPERASKRDGQSSADTALVILDIVNCFDFPGAERLKPLAEAAALRISELKSAATKRRMPIIYVNDNFGKWHAERSQLVEQARAGSDRIVALLAPQADDLFVIKPQFSGFYATNLPVLLPKLGVSRLILTGIATDICVLFTAADAHMRDYALWVPEDAVAAENGERHRWALEIMRQSMGAQTASTTELSIESRQASLE